MFNQKGDGYMICWLNSAGNDIQHARQDLFLQQGIYVTKNTGNHGFSLQPSCFRQGIAIYSSKTLIKNNWINSNNVFISEQK